MRREETEKRQTCNKRRKTRRKGKNHNRHGKAKGQDQDQDQEPRPRLRLRRQDDRQGQRKAPQRIKTSALRLGLSFFAQQSPHRQEGNRTRYILPEPCIFPSTPSGGSCSCGCTDPPQPPRSAPEDEEERDVFVVVWMGSFVLFLFFSLLQASGSFLSFIPLFFFL